MAREHGLDLAAISGTGPQGRVLKADVQAALDLGRAPEPVNAPRAKLVPLPSAGADQRIPIRGLRKKIAEKMVRSKFTAPHSLFVEEVDVTQLVALRKRLNAGLADSGESLKISFLPFVCKALIPVFRKYPSLNANFDDAAQELVQRGSLQLRHRRGDRRGPHRAGGEGRGPAHGPAAGRGDRPGWARPRATRS